MPLFDSGGLPLYYAEYGSHKNEPVIFVHPAPLDHLAWIYQIPYFAQSFRVIVLDQRCFGLSAKPEFEFDISEYGRDLQALMRELKLKSSYVVGLSLGGIAAQFLALFDPSSIRAVVLADTLSATGGSVTIKERVRRFRADGVAGYYADVVKSLCSERFLLTDVGRYFLHLFVERSKSLSTPALIRCYEALSKLNITGSLPSIHVPALVVAGTNDYAFSDSRLIAEKLPNAEFVPLQGLGHLTQIEAPESFNSLVLDFFSRHV